MLLVAKLMNPIPQKTFPEKQSKKCTERVIETCSIYVTITYWKFRIKNAIQTAIMTSTYGGKPKPQLAIDNRRKRNGLLMYSKAGHMAGLYENAIRAVLLQISWCSSGVSALPKHLQHISGGYPDTCSR